MQPSQSNKPIIVELYLGYQTQLLWIKKRYKQTSFALFAKYTVLHPLVSIIAKAPKAWHLGRYNYIAIAFHTRNTRTSMGPRAFVAYTYCGTSKKYIRHLYQTFKKREENKLSDTILACDY